MHQSSLVRRSYATCGAALLLSLSLALGVGCSSAPAPGEAAGESGAAASGGGDAGTKDGARVLGIPGSSPGSMTTHEQGGGVLHWSIPEDWIEEPPSSSMRLAQYRIPGPAGDAQCVVFYFGPGQGGEPMANARRWAGQFTGPDGQPLQEFASERVEGSAVPVIIVEVHGTYSGGMTGTMEPAESEPGAMLLGAIAEGPDAPWFFKMTGPEATVEGQRQAFVTFLRSMHVAEGA